LNWLLFFWLFLKASLLSFGGLGNLPFLLKDMIALGWATDADFINAIAVGQLSPGPTGLWSISLGYLTFGWLGSLLALVAISIPPLFTLVMVSFYHRIEKYVFVKNFSRGMMLGVIGLMLGTTWRLAQTTITEWRDLIIVVAAFGLAVSKKVPVIVIFVLAGLAGFLFYGG
jgi:chromate transporter